MNYRLSQIKAPEYSSNQSIKLIPLSEAQSKLESDLTFSGLNSKEENTCEEYGTCDRHKTIWN